MSSHDDLMKKVKVLKDLRDAISLVKEQACLSKKDDKPATDKGSVSDTIKQHRGSLKHSGIYEIIPGVLTHVIRCHDLDKASEVDGHHYNIDVNLKKMSEKKPCISVNVVDKSGKSLDRSPNEHKSMEKAVSEMMQHFKKGAWL